MVLPDPHQLLPRYTLNCNRAIHLIPALKCPQYVNSPPAFASCYLCHPAGGPRCVCVLLWGQWALHPYRPPPAIYASSRPFVIAVPGMNGLLHSLELFSSTEQRMVIGWKVPHPPQCNAPLVTAKGRSPTCIVGVAVPAMHVSPALIEITVASTVPPFCNTCVS